MVEKFKFAFLFQWAIFIFHDTVYNFDLAHSIFRLFTHIFLMWTMRECEAKNVPFFIVIILMLVSCS